MSTLKSKLVLAGVATAIAAAASITRADEQPVVYGRAGYQVAEQRIQQLSQIPARDSASQAEHVVTWYGRAGYPVGSDAVTTIAGAPSAKAYAAGQTRLPKVYGRAGVPLPFDQ